MTRFNFLKRGKVREIFESEDKQRLLIVASDRIYAFDCVIPTPIPQKGAMLTKLSNHWFRLTKHIVPNHILVEEPKDIIVDLDLPEMPARSVIVQRAESLPVEAIVRATLQVQRKNIKSQECLRIELEKES
jgi:phosphoribosylaminoimidazole-succinocarboxamide synthase